MLKVMDWNWCQLDRQARVSAGECVVANMRQNTDEALIEWAKATGRFVRIDRWTLWSNPFVAPADGDRATVLGRFKVEIMPGLAPLLASLHGRVLGGWSHPAPCHGDLIAEAVNQDTTSATPLPERPAGYPKQSAVNYPI